MLHDPWCHTGKGNWSVILLWKTWCHLPPKFTQSHGGVPLGNTKTHPSLREKKTRQAPCLRNLSPVETHLYGPATQYHYVNFAMSWGTTSNGASRRRTTPKQGSSLSGRWMGNLLNTPIWWAWGSGSWAQRPLPTGIVRRQFPSLRGTTWCNNGSSTRNGSRFEHDNCILSGEY